MSEVTELAARWSRTLVPSEEPRLPTLVVAITASSGLGYDLDIVSRVDSNAIPRRI
jgi:hypothetical protein